MTEIEVLPPTQENLDRALDEGRTVRQRRYWIDTYSRDYRCWRYAVVHSTDDGRFYVMQKRLRRFVSGVRVLRVDGKITYCFGVVLGATEKIG